ncbi:MAG: DUF721 domain-containing protein [Sphingomonadales bacterium]|nr:DUF721 domain-containing protein [Sphingomonadales bacterium]
MTAAMAKRPDSSGPTKSVKAARAAKPKPATKPRTKLARPPERARGGAARNIADLMPEIGRAAFRRFGFVQSSIVTRWPEIAGARYAEVTAPESLRFPHGKREGGTLHLTVSGAHAPMLQHVEPELIERVNRFFGYRAVERIRMTQGRVTPPAPPPDRPPAILKPIPIELGESLRDVGDPELKKVLESLAAGLANSSGPPKIG